MKLIINTEIIKGYENLKNIFLSVDQIREKYGVKVLAYGHPKENEDKVYQVIKFLGYTVRHHLLPFHSIH